MNAPLATNAAPDLAALIRKYNVPGPRYTSYPTAVQFADDAPRDALVADAERDFATGNDLSLYVHIPFCETLCWYCACNTVTTRDHARSAAYLEDIAREVALWQRHFSTSPATVKTPRAAQLHLGGGTPSFLAPAEIARLAEILHGAFAFAPDAEISVEIDPRRLTPAHVAAFRDLGATRASFGVQDFDPAAQRAINRLQSLEQTADAMRWARDAGFTSLNFDLIYGLPAQSEETFARTLDAVVQLAPDRVAVFSYAHVPWMRPAQKIFERAGNLPPPATKLALLQMVVERLTGAGYVHIGMDHFARPDDELAHAQREHRLHRNFQGYSTKAGLSLLGLGATSISQTPFAFRQNEKDPARYAARLAAGELPVQRGALLSDEDRRRREIIMRLMCDCELDYAALEQTFAAAGIGISASTGNAAAGSAFAARYAVELERLAPLAADGLVALDPAGLRVLPAGRYFLRNIAMAFDAYLPRGANTAGENKNGTTGSTAGSAVHHSKTI